MHCLGCGYNLKQLTEPRCPECGRGFDAQDKQTWGLPMAYRWRPIARVASLVFIAGVGLQALFLFVAILLGADLIVAFYVALLLGLIPVVLAGVLWSIGISAGNYPPRKRTRYAVAFLFLFIASLLTRWPTHIGFLISRPALERLAKEAEADHRLPKRTPTWAGVFYITKIELRGDNADHTVFHIHPNLPSADYIAHGMTDTEVGKSFNVWSWYRVNDEWHIVTED